METKHTLGSLIETLNAKARAAGENIKAVHVTLDATWGDHCGLAIVGSGNKERAVKFARTYYAQHLAGQRSYDAQYAYSDRGSDRIVLGENGASHAGQLARLADDQSAPAHDARVLGIVYWPCAD